MSITYGVQPVLHVDALFFTFPDGIRIFRISVLINFIHQNFKDEDKNIVAGTITVNFPGWY